jgi:hypothetical protein
VGKTRLVALVVVVVVGLIFGVSSAIDFVRASTVRVVIQVTPAELPADGASVATVSVQYLNADHTPRAGDVIDLVDVSDNAGTILRLSQVGNYQITLFRAVTDRRGMIRFKYRAAQSNPFTPTEPAHLRITDTSLGTLLEFDKNTAITIKVFDPSNPPKGNS